MDDYLDGDLCTVFSADFAAPQLNGIVPGSVPCRISGVSGRKTPGRICGGQGGEVRRPPRGCRC